MKITFNIEYATAQNQTLEIVFTDGKVLSMTSPDGYHQRATMSAPGPEPESQELHYSYRVMGPLGVEVMEYSRLPHRLILEQGYDNYTIQDCWQYIPWDKGFYSAAMSNVFFARDSGQEPWGVGKSYERAVTFDIYAPQVAPHCHVVVTGDAQALGGWDPRSGVRLSGRDFPRWRVTVDGQGLPPVSQYKFVIVDSATGEVVMWEDGDNRELRPAHSPGEHKVLEGLHFAMQPSFRCAGVAVPVFSLRGEQCWGIGDFGALKEMVDFAALSSMRVVQLLPVTDTTATHGESDSYPYSSISAFALHPLYLAPIRMGVLKDYSQMEYYTLQAAKLNAQQEVDYAGVDELKWSYFTEIYAQNGRHTLEGEDFKAFFELNKEWLEPYGVFCYLRQKYRTVDFTKWKELSVWDHEAAMALCDPSCKSYRQVAMHYFLQYHLHLQLSEAADYARSRGVVLKGDLPIGVSPHSVELWSQGELFNVGTQAGAPPDDFAVLGQNWGFPTYNWQTMQRDGFSWFTRRLGHMAQYFDMYRIDHVLGFFRIWQIPSDGVTALLGQFSPALGFTARELDELWGLPMCEQRYTTPYIHRAFVHHYFGQHTAAAMKYMDKVDAEIFALKPICDNQIKIQALFQGDHSPQGQALMQGLMRLTEEVIFVRDAQDPELFHPRVMARNTYSYWHLYDWEKERFDALYDNYFYSRHDDFWAQSAINKLPLVVDSTAMLCCGEDLGMVPHCVPGVMERLRILTLEIERMPKTPGHVVVPAASFPYRSVCTTSTHDMVSLRMWWAQDPELTQKYYNQILMLPAEAPTQATEGVCTAIIERHLCCSSQFCIIPLADWLSMFANIRAQNPDNEQINNPANPNHTWNYRMHLNLEQLLKPEITDKISRLIALSGR